MLPRTNIQTYNLHGLRVRSQIPLPAPVTRTSQVDLDVRWSRRPARSGELAGRTVAQLTLDDGRGYRLVRTRRGWTLRFDRIGDFRFDAPLERLDIDLAPGGNRAIVPLLVAGNVAAFVLSLTGHCILHASAVQFEEEAVGFIGSSGMGKSTLAALCCASGARLVADDMLRLAPANDGFRCVRGPSQLRLREAARSLAACFPADAVRPTADFRLALDVASADSRLPLRVLAVPLPSRECQSISIRRLTPVESLYALTRNARIVGWRAQELIARQFAQLGRVAARVPVYSVTIPWGPPFAPTVGKTLLESLIALTRRRAAA